MDKEHKPKIDFSLLENITQQFPFYFLACDKNGDVFYYSQNGAAELYGMSPEELGGMNVHRLHEEGWIDRPAATADCLTQRKKIMRYMKSRAGKGMIVYSEPIFDDKGDLYMAISFTYDEEFFNTFQNTIQKDRQQFLDALHYIEQSKGSKYYTESRNPRMRETLELARTVAETDSTVNIFGETGTGKEILARYIHANSARARMPFIPVNCAAIPAELVEAEFFGYAKNAFTGANPGGKSGLFEMAHQGTLFLDEIGELPLTMQSKLLRAIETGEVRRIGDSALVQTNVRIITATNRRLSEMVEAKTFREDLYYRLNIISLTVLPLRERREDILPLAKHLLAQFNEKRHSSRYFSESIQHFFMTYDWPGNIREMKNIIERLCIISPSDELVFREESENYACPKGRVPEAAPEVSGGIAEGGGAPVEEGGAAAGKGLKQAVHDYELRYIRQVIDQCGGNMSKAARQLGIHRSQLYSRLKQ
ncbi:MAG: sigma 54-interacting transcriptional regulator [Clostridiales Family XIII bacterium]|jgi:transcriptional regulator with PAS, ATPase and Fis domain|nr:sigma 54-interacting transcriptional regulator [Clostridiales Family XIII bacterium]